MKPDWVALTHLWQRRGFMNMPDAFRTAFFRGLNTPAVGTSAEWEARPGAVDRYIRSCDQWVKMSGLPDLDTRWSEIRPHVVGGALALRHGYHRFTVADVEWDLSEPQAGRVRVPRATTTNVYECWLGEAYTYAVLWGLLYHTENEYLRRPKLLRKMLVRHQLDWSLLFSDEISSHSPVLVSWEMARYERLLALHADAAQRAAHHVANIDEREGLKPEERTERVELFRRAIAKLLEESVSELRDLLFFGM